MVQRKVVYGIAFLCRRTTAMMRGMIKRFDRLEVVTSDVAGTAGVYRQNFGFTVRPSAPPGHASIVVGDTEIRLRAEMGPEKLTSPVEGLAAIWLETEDVYQAADALNRAGIAADPVRIEDDRRVLAIKPEAANMVPVFIFDRH
jgi:Glyoxalase/Bleomycin resistance protein/Dioxygenase superfamily